MILDRLCPLPLGMVLRGPLRDVLLSAVRTFAAQVVEKTLGWSVAAESGAGAAGGLGFGLRAFAGARLESGFNLFARSARLEERIASADLVITGEGAIDASTLMGKGVGEIARLCRRFQVSCIGLAGALLPTGRPGQELDLFTRVYGIVPDLACLEESRERPQIWVPRLAALAAQQWKPDEHPPHSR